jgi:hypothetical protein
MLTGVRGALQAAVVVGLFRCFPTTVNITLFVQTGIGAKAPMRLPKGLRTDVRKSTFVYFLPLAKL